MGIFKASLWAAAMLTFAGCAQPESPAPSETPAPAPAPTESPNETPIDTPIEAPLAEHQFKGWAGKWIGVEGMFVEIVPAGNGAYTLVMQSDLDTLGTYEGTDSADGIIFTRGEDTLLLRKGTGDETGLKYLAGKTKCLVVAPGEGYCLD